MPAQSMLRLCCYYLAKHGTTTRPWSDMGANASLEEAQDLHAGIRASTLLPLQGLQRGSVCVCVCSKSIGS